MTHDVEHDCADPAGCPVHGPLELERERAFYAEQEARDENARLQADPHLLETCCGRCPDICRFPWPVETSARRP